MSPIPNARDVTLDLIGRDKTKAATTSAGRNFDKLSQQLDKANAKNKKFADKFKAVGDKVQRGADLALAAMVGIGVGSVKMAAAAEQSIGSVQTVFGKYAKTVIDSSKKASRAVGLSADEYRNAATLIGAQLKNQGVAQAKLGKETDKLIRLGADFSSMFGGTAAQAVDALSSALKGEFDPLEKYGVTLKQSTINAEAFRLANVKGATAFGKLSTAQQAAYKRQATLNIIFGQGKDAVGNFAREADTASHRAQVLAARAKDLAVKLGNDLMPVAEDMAGAAEKLATWLEKDSKNIRLLSEGVGLATLSIKSFKAGPLVGSLVTIGSALEILSLKYQRFNDTVVGVNDANKEDLQSLVVFWLGVVDKILTAWGTISPTVRSTQKKVHGMLAAAQADLDATHAKWDKTAEGIKNRPIIAKLKADKADLEANVAAARKRLKTVHDAKTEAIIRANIKAAEKSLADIKAQLRALDGTTAETWVRTHRETYYGVHGTPPTNPHGDGKSAGGDSWQGSAPGGQYRTEAPRVVMGDTTNVTRVFLDSREIRSVARTAVMDETRRAGSRARVGRR